VACGRTCESGGGAPETLVGAIAHGRERKSVGVVEMVKDEWADNFLMILF
jgi:hypothetical protein